MRTITSIYTNARLCKRLRGVVSTAGQIFLVSFLLLLLLLMSASFHCLLLLLTET